MHYRTGLHWITLFPAVLLISILVSVGGLIIIAAQQVLFGLLIVCVGAFMLIMSVLARNATEMAITSKRVVIKKGLLKRRTIELFLSKLESVDVEQGIIGRMLGYGTIVVRGTGGSSEPFRQVRSPLEFRRQVQMWHTT